MRRRKIDITEDVNDMVKSVVEFLPNDMKSITSHLSKANDIIPKLEDMKHNDYINCRKHLLDAEKKIKEMRKNVLQTYKIFTEEYD